MKTAEEIFYEISKANRDIFNNDVIFFDKEMVEQAMKAYASQLIDQIAEEATYQNTTGYGQGLNTIDKQSILRFKELLK